MADRIVDLTEEQPAADRLITLPQRFYTPTEVSVTQAERTERTREQMRGRIALVLTASLLILVVFTLLYVILAPLDPDQLVMVIQGVGATILTPIVGLIGAVTGFYYGGKQLLRRWLLRQLLDQMEAQVLMVQVVRHADRR